MRDDEDDPEEAEAMAGARFRGLGNATAMLLSGGALMLLPVLLGLAAAPGPVEAASAAKPKKASRPDWMAVVTIRLAAKPLSDPGFLIRWETRWMRQN